MSTRDYQDSGAFERTLLKGAFWLLVFVNLGVAVCTVRLTWRPHIVVRGKPSVLEELFLHLQFAIVVPVCFVVGVLSLRMYLLLCEEYDTTGERSWDNATFWSRVREPVTAVILCLCVLGLLTDLVPWSLAEIEDQPGMGRIGFSDVYYTGIESELGLLCMLLYCVVLLALLLTLGWVQPRRWPAAVVTTAGIIVVALAMCYIMLNLHNAGPAPARKDFQPWALSPTQPKEGIQTTVIPSGGVYLTLFVGVGLAVLGWIQGFRFQLNRAIQGDWTREEYLVISRQHL